MSIGYSESLPTAQSDKHNKKADQANVTECKQNS